MSIISDIEKLSCKCNEKPDPAGGGGRSDFEEEEGTISDIFLGDEEHSDLGEGEDDDETIGMREEDIKHAAQFEEEVGSSGINLGKFHGGYFSRPVIAQVFPQAVEQHVVPYLKSIQKPSVIGLGTGPGLPEILVHKMLRDLEIDHSFVLSDRIRSAVVTQYPGYGVGEDEVTKMILDNKDLPFPDNSINLILTRCSRHYESLKANGRRVLEEVFRVLEPGGYFINQEQALPTQKEADLANFQRGLVGKFSDHRTASEILSMHKEIFGEENVRLADQQPGPLFEDALGFFQRFNVPEEKRGKIITVIRRRIIKWQDDLVNAQLQDDPNNPFRRDTPFQLIVSRKMLGK